MEADEDAQNIEGGSHQRYVSNEITEADVSKAIDESPSSPTSPVSISISPPTSEPQSITNKKQPVQHVTALLSKMRLAFSDLNKKRPPSLSSNGSDSEFEDREEGVNEITITVSGNSSGNNSDVSKSPSDILAPLSTAAKKVTEVLDGITSDYGGSSKINIKDPIEKKVSLENYFI